ncbi:MAG: MarR family winged helix-turn-helix transcriptional regulator [Vulcanimicrobiaceae bacterium]
MSTNAPHMPDAEEFRYLVLAAQREGNRVFAEALKPLDLTPSSAEVIRVLSDHGPLSLSGLGELLVCETGTPSRLVARMVETGLLERSIDPADRRGILLSLSRRGQTAAKKLRSIEDHLHGTIAAAIGDADIASLRAVLWRFVNERPAGKALARRIRNRRSNP